MFCEIAQVFRGIVGAVRIVGSSGPVNNHAYDDRLREHDPPQFLHPIHATWRIQRGDGVPVGTTLRPGTR